MRALAPPRRPDQRDELPGVRRILNARIDVRQRREMREKIERLKHEANILPAITRPPSRGHVLEVFAEHDAFTVIVIAMGSFTPVKSCFIRTICGANLLLKPTIKIGAYFPRASNTA